MRYLTDKERADQLREQFKDQYLTVDRENDVKNCSLTIYRPNVDGSIRLREYNTVVYPE